MEANGILYPQIKGRIELGIGFFCGCTDLQLELHTLLNVRVQLGDDSIQNIMHMSSSSNGTFHCSSKVEGGQMGLVAQMGPGVSK